MMRGASMLVCEDDKHHVKVGEPACPVAAAERGRQVIEHGRSALQVADHDFTRLSIVPSVVFEVNNPDSIAGSWYDANVHVLYKDAAFEPSSPIIGTQLSFPEAKVQHIHFCFFTLMVDQTTVSRTLVSN